MIEFIIKPGRNGFVLPNKPKDDKTVPVADRYRKPALFGAERKAPEVPPEIIRHRAALLIAVAKVMVVNRVTAPVALSGSYDKELIAYMMEDFDEDQDDAYEPGLSEQQAKFMLTIDLSQAIDSQ